MLIKIWNSVDKNINRYYLTHLIWKGCGHLQVPFNRTNSLVWTSKVLLEWLQFIAKITQRFTEALELNYELHTFWHPESKMNHILNKTLAKLCQETHEHWTMQSSGSLYPLGVVWDLANLKWPTRGLFLLLTFYCMRTSIGPWIYY